MEEDDEQPVTLTDKLKFAIATTPCAKQTITYSLGSYTAAFLGMHGWTGRGIQANKAGLLAFTIVSIAVFVPCRRAESIRVRQYRELEETLMLKGEAMANLAADQERRDAEAAAQSL